MSLWTIVPVKPLRRGKSRLAGVLSDNDRALLNMTMLSNTLRTLQEVTEVDNVLVVSRDPAALAIARNYNARTVQEDGSPGLNMALQRATVVAQIYNAQEVLVMPADLPLITPEEVRLLINFAGDPPAMVIAPDRRGDGTNALYLRPVGAVDYRFGPGSFQYHLQQARQHGIHVEIYNSPIFGLDLDVPEDLDLLRQMDAVPARSES